MQSDRKIAFLFAAASWFSALEAVVAIVYLFGIPSDPKNVFLFSLSKQRLALVLVFVALFLLFVAGGLLIAKRSNLISRRFTQTPGRRLFNLSMSVLFVIFLFGWILTFVPPYRLAGFSAYFERLHPLIVWVMLTSLQTLFCLCIWRWGFRFDHLLKELRSSRTLWVVAICAFGVCITIWVFILITSLGTIPDIWLWNETGVPVLGIQVIVSILLGLALFFLLAVVAETCTPIRRLLTSKPRLFDFCIAFLIWLTAVLLWSLVPQVKSFFAPGPYPPNEAFYPYSDAALYDTSAQMALIGQGLNGGAYVDKPLYSAFLVLLNFIAGENFNLVVTLQVMALAFLPVTAYLLGKSFHSRGLGLALALMIVFKQYNAIRATVWVSTSTSRILISEVPTALFIVLITLWAFTWVKNRGNRLWEAMIVGGLLGLSTLVRHNMWVLLPALILISLVVFGFKSFRKWFWNCTLLTLMVIVSIVPWSIRLQRQGGQPFGLLIPLIGTVWENRYLPAIQDQDAVPSLSEPGQPSFSEPSSSEPYPQEDSQPGTSAAFSEPLSFSDSSFSEPDLPTGQDLSTSPPQPAAATDRVERFILSHFFHNIITSVLELPHHFLLHDLETLTTMPGNHWERDWQGKLQPGSWVLILFNLAMISLGIGVAIKQWGAAGLLPLGIYFAYLASNAVARTSGGRYLVPFDWLLFLYFLAGCFQAVFWLMALFGFSLTPKAAAPLQKPALSFKAYWLLGFAILALGALVPLSEIVEPLRYTETNQEIIAALIEGDSLGVESPDLIAFSAQPNAVIMKGRALYPRFYYSGQGEPGIILPLQSADYPRMVFGFLSVDFSGYVIVPTPFPPEIFPHSSDVIVLGCRSNSERIDAYAVILQGDTESVILRDPAAAFTCPLPQPVCDNNHVCK